MRSARYPYYKRSPQPLITSAFKNVFLQTDLPTPTSCTCTMPENSGCSTNDLLDKDILHNNITGIVVKQSLRHNEPKKFRAFGPKFFNEHPLGRSSKFVKNAIFSLPTHMVASLVSCNHYQLFIPSRGGREDTPFQPRRSDAGAAWTDPKRDIVTGKNVLN